ncbi:MAG: NAD(P)/FAD-dependent oxidoreductase [Myxococcota bacterium]
MSDCVSDKSWKSSRTFQNMGQTFAPPISTLQRQPWDVIIVGAGHNGLTCASYLSQAGLRVLVLEALPRVGGACTLEEIWPGYLVSPCAYLAGLLHQSVIDELKMKSYGFRWTPADTGLFVPLNEQEAVQFWDDDARCHRELGRICAQDIPGYEAMYDAMDRLRDALRPDDENDLWLDVEPSREKILERLRGDEEAQAILFDWSMVEMTSHFLSDARLQSALLGQGVIGTYASPFDPGTASIHFHHYCGRMGGIPGAWGYVEGGMGMVSFLLCDIAKDAGATVVTDAPVAEILPEEGVRLSSGERIHAPVVISNADPRRTLSMLEKEATPAWRQQVEALPQEGCTLKVTVVLNEMPNFLARPGLFEPHHQGQINTPLTHEQWKVGFAKAQQGLIPDMMWTELYFQTAYDKHVAPEGKHIMSVFAQYVPTTPASGSWEAPSEAWETQKRHAAQVALDSIGRFCSNLPEAIDQFDISTPHDIQQRVGLTGGHIFQGECLPPYMWDKRLHYRTATPGVYMCGACTHPGGSVIAVNGRNAAKVVLQDLNRPFPHS